MKKKIMIVSILAIFALISVSFAASGLYVIDKTKKESPLYKVRAMGAINEKVNQVKAKLSTRIFFLPVLLQRFSQAESIEVAFANHQTDTTETDCVTYIWQTCHVLCKK